MEEYNSKSLRISFSLTRILSDSLINPYNYIFYKMHKLLILFWISPLILTSSLQACPDSYFFDSQHCEECELNCICSSYMGCDECI